MPNALSVNREFGDLLNFDTDDCLSTQYQTLLGLNNFLQTAIAFAWARRGVRHFLTDRLSQPDNGFQTDNRRTMDVEVGYLDVEVGYLDINYDGQGVKEAELDAFISSTVGTENYLARILKRNFDSLKSSTGSVNIAGVVLYKECIITNATLDKYIQVMNSHFRNHVRMF